MRNSHSATLPATPPHFFYGWIILIACFVITTVASGTMMGFGVFINPMADDMGWSHSALALAYAISSLVTGVGVLIVGSILHSRSVRLIFLLSTLVHCVGIYMTSTVTSIEAFYFWYGFVASVGRSAFFMSTTTLITRWFERRRGLFMGIMMSGNGLGPFIFSPLVSWMIFRWDWQTAYLLLSINMTICLTISCLLIRNHPTDMGLEPYGGVPSPTPARPSAAGPKAPAPAANSTGALWGAVLRMESFWSMSWINFFCCVCHSIPLVHVVSFAQDAGLSAFTSAWVLAIMNISSIVGRIYWGIFADRHGGRFALMLTLFLQGTLILWLVNTQDPVLFFLYALLWGFGYGGVGTQYGIVSREIYGVRLFGPGYSGQNSFAMVGMALGGFLGGYLYDVSGSYVTSWIISFLSGVVSSLLAMDLMAQEHRSAPARAPSGAVAPSAASGRNL